HPLFRQGDPAPNRACARAQAAVAARDAPATRAASPPRSTRSSLTDYRSLRCDRDRWLHDLCPRIRLDSKGPGEPAAAEREARDTAAASRLPAERAEGA